MAAASTALNPEFLSCIDISTLSQDELHALSLCSHSSFDPRRTDDVVVPNIDRSVFNESAGSRRQTYSRLRLRPSTGHHRPRLPGLLPSPKSLPSIDQENKSIVSFLKQLVHAKNYHSDSPSPQPPSINSNYQIVPVPQASVYSYGVTERGHPAQEMAVVVHSGERKRKRGRKPKTKMKLTENSVGVQLEIVNRNGVAVDLAALANADELYSEELKRRTVGLEREEEVLGFLRVLEGQWCSRRRKRKFVDASHFGDSLPIGWKLLLGLRRRDGRVSVYCRRFVSPSGQHFISCKEVAAYLQSHFGVNNNSNLQMNQSISVQQSIMQVSTTHAGFDYKDNDIVHDVDPISTLPSSALFYAPKKELSLVGIENLPEVQVRDLFECYKCNMTFDEKNTYLEHLLSYHQRTTRRYRLGTAVGEGVIIKDGKYECQFCHKVFEERRSYNGHVGIHVRNYVRGSEESLVPLTIEKNTGSQAQDALVSKISKMDALIEIAQNSILENSSAVPDIPPGGSSPHRPAVEESSAAISDHEISWGSDANEECMANKDLDQELNLPNDDYTVIDGKIVMIDSASNVENHKNVAALEDNKNDELEKDKSGELETDLGNGCFKQNHDAVNDNMGEALEENDLQRMVTDSTMNIVQSLDCFPAFTAESKKGEIEFGAGNQKLDNINGFDDLRLDEIEPFRYSFVTGQELSSFPDVSMELTNSATMEENFDSSVRFDSQDIMLNMVGRNQVTTLCVWCRTEFSHDAIDSEAQSDSIGFMCPTCKSKISGHLDCGLSMSSHQF